MCETSIIEYLSNSFNDKEAIKELVLNQITDNKYIKENTKKIIDKLLNIKVLDPAIGSGAFPMGMLHEIVKILSNIDKSRDLGVLKREIIENSIYGIDIEPSAVEIAKLRFWLSIVVDEDEPIPLPNLFYKIMVGNSLVETVNGFDPFTVDSNNLFGNNEVDNIQKLLHKYYNQDNSTKKAKLKSKIDESIKKIFTQKIEEYKNQIDLKSQRLNIGKVAERNKLAKEIESDMQNLGEFQEIIQENPITKLFFYKLYFAEVINAGNMKIKVLLMVYIHQIVTKVKQIFGIFLLVKELSF